MAEAELKILHVAEEHALVPEAELKILPVAELQMENPIWSCAVVPWAAQVPELNSAVPEAAAEAAV